MDPNAIIIPCHNRREVTLTCLKKLEQQGILKEFHVIVVDDGSTDGTLEAVREQFPQVEILHGDGNLYWTGAMELGMRHAYASGAGCFVWLNDDLLLGERALQDVVALAIQRQCIGSGQGIINQENGSQWAYPLQYRGKRKLRVVAARLPATEPISVDTCRGNLVAIPRCVVEKIGYPDGKNIPHIGGDTDYTLRATAAGISCLTLPNAFFYEEETIRNDNDSWLMGNQPLRTIWRRALHRRGSLYPRMHLVYHLRHWGALGAIDFLAAYLHLSGISLLRLFVPRSILRRLFAKKSQAYTAYKDRFGDAIP